jgi:hypothetical protein
MEEAADAALNNAGRVHKGRQVHLPPNKTQFACAKRLRSLTDKCFAHGGGRTCQYTGCTKSAQGGTAGKLRYFYSHLPSLTSLANTKEERIDALRMAEVDAATYQGAGSPYKVGVLVVYKPILVVLIQNQLSMRRFDIYLSRP